MTLVNLGPQSGENVSVSDTSSVTVTDSNGFGAGSYDADDDGRADVIVRSAQLSTLRVETAGGTNVAGRTARVGETLRATPEFNFESADAVRVVVRRQGGETVQTRTVSQSGASVQIPTDGLADGTYVVSASDASGDLGTSRQATVTLVDESVVLGLDTAQVTRGQGVGVSVSGSPGDTAIVGVLAGAVATDRLNARLDDLGRSRTDGNRARLLFAGASNADAGRTGDRYYVEYPLNNNGRAADTLLTQYLEVGQLTVSADDSVGGVSDGQPASSRQLRVRAPVLTASAPATTVIGRSLTVEGAAETGQVLYAYVRDGDTWRALSSPTDASARARATARRSRYPLPVRTAGGPLATPGTYRVAVVAADQGSQPPDRISRSEFGNYNTREVTVRMIRSVVTATLSQPTTARSDTVTIRGDATGDREGRAYVLAPGGAVAYRHDVPIRSDRWSLVANEADFDRVGNDRLRPGGTYRSGTHRVVVVGSESEGTFDVDTRRLLNRLRDTGQNEARDLIRSTYRNADGTVLIERSFTAEEPSVSIDAVGDGDVTETGRVTVSGRSNRAEGARLTVRVVDRATDRVATSRTVTVDASGRWSTTVDLSETAGTDYRVTVSDRSSNASAQGDFRVSRPSLEVTTVSGLDRNDAEHEFTPEITISEAENLRATDVTVRLAVREAGGTVVFDRETTVGSLRDGSRNVSFDVGTLEEGVYTYTVTTRGSNAASVTRTGSFGVFGPSLEVIGISGLMSDTTDREYAPTVELREMNVVEARDLDVRLSVFDADDRRVYDSQRSADRLSGNNTRVEFEDVGRLAPGDYRYELQVTGANVPTIERTGSFSVTGASLEVSGVDGLGDAGSDEEYSPQVTVRETAGVTARNAAVRLTVRDSDGLTAFGAGRSLDSFGGELQNATFDVGPLPPGVYSYTVEVTGTGTEPAAREGS
ncbi:hypothetical protein BRD17_07890, partial [Halobacteriales archaeon SW_7_68_16]